MWAHKGSAIRTVKLKGFTRGALDKSADLTKPLHSQILNILHVRNSVHKSGGKYKNVKLLRRIPTVGGPVYRAQGCLWHSLLERMTNRKIEL